MLLCALHFKLCTTGINSVSDLTCVEPHSLCTAPELQAVACWRWGLPACRVPGSKSRSSDKQQTWNGFHGFSRELYLVFTEAGQSTALRRARGACSGGRDTKWSR